MIMLMSQVADAGAHTTFLNQLRQYVPVAVLFSNEFLRRFFLFEKSDDHNLSVTAFNNIYRLGHAILKYPFYRDHCFLLILKMIKKRECGLKNPIPQPAFYTCQLNFLEFIPGADYAVVPTAVALA